jgi:peptide deformylase
MMAIVNILTVLDPMLKTVSKPVETVDDSVRLHIQNMFDTMYEAPGIGLAAIQIGVPLRLIVMDLGNQDPSQIGIDNGSDENTETIDRPEVRSPRVFINPEIVWASEETSIYDEGCLSVPEYYDNVERPSRVRIQYLNEDGKSQSIEAHGLLATCIQHEMDHLNGILFIDHLSRLRRERAVAKVKKQRRA